MDVGFEELTVAGTPNLAAVPINQTVSLATRRAIHVRRIAALPQAFVTTTTLDDLDPELLAIATAWEVRSGPDGAWLVAAPARVPG